MDSLGGVASAFSAVLRRNEMGHTMCGNQSEQFEDSSMISKEDVLKEDVDKALDEIDRHGIPARRRSIGYCLEARGRHYPPKYVLSLACRLKTGKGHPPLRGGEPLNAWLRPFYPVVPHDCRNPDLKIVR
jgi:hypothetical protein